MHRRRQTKPLVLPSSIMHELAPYQFYLSMAGQQILKTQTRVMDLPKVAPEFIMRPELRLDYIAQQAAKAAADAAALVSETKKERAALAQEQKAKQIDAEVQKEVKEQQRQAGLDLIGAEIDF